MNEKPLTLRDHEVKKLLSTGDVLIVRPVKPQPWWIESPHMEGDKWVGAYSKDTDITNPTYQARCPYPVGSRWWVRETWCMTGAGCVLHKADHKTEQPYWATLKWNAAITMPRWASRITLEVTGVRVERLQDITYDDILAEGWNSRTSEPITDGTAGEDARAWYIALWDSINARRGYPWVSNPWVWVVEFAVAGGDR